MKRKPTTWTIGNGWQRKTYKRGTRYFHKNKRVTRERFEAAYKRKLSTPRRPKWEKIIPPPEKGKRSHKRKVIPEPRRKGKVDGDFCKLKTRQQFYETLLHDRRKFREEVGEETASGFQLWFQIGDGIKRRKKSDRRLQYTHGLRKFTDLRKARLFLGFDGATTSGDRPLPRWTKNGKNAVCRFEKKAWLVVTRRKRNRAIEPKILKKYIIQD